MTELPHLVSLCGNILDYCIGYSVEEFWERVRERAKCGKAVLILWQAIIEYKKTKRLLTVLIL